MGIITGYVRESGRCLQEISIIELRLPHHQPALFEERIVFFLFLPGTLFGIIAPSRFLRRLCFDGVELDRFIAFLDRPVERASRFRLVFGLGTDRVHQYHVGIAFLIAVLHGKQRFVKRCFSVEIDIIAGIKSVIEAACLGILLRTARPKQRDNQ